MVELAETPAPSYTLPIMEAAQCAGIKTYAAVVGRSQSNSTADDKAHRKTGSGLREIFSCGMRQNHSQRSSVSADQNSRKCRDTGVNQYKEYGAGSGQYARNGVESNQVMESAMESSDQMANLIQSLYRENRILKTELNEMRKLKETCSRCFKIQRQSEQQEHLEKKESVLEAKRPAEVCNLREIFSRREVQSRVLGSASRKSKLHNEQGMKTVNRQVKECNLRSIFARREPQSRVWKPDICSSNRKQSELKPCKFCTESHVWGADKCTAYGHKCRKCLKWNHRVEYTECQLPEISLIKVK